MSQVINKPPLKYCTYLATSQGAMWIFEAGKEFKLRQVETWKLLARQQHPYGPGFPYQSPIYRTSGIGTFQEPNTIYQRYMAQVLTRTRALSIVESIERDHAITSAGPVSAVVTPSKKFTLVVNAFTQLITNFIISATKNPNEPSQTYSGRSLRGKPVPTVQQAISKKDFIIKDRSVRLFSKC